MTALIRGVIGSFTVATAIIMTVARVGSVRCYRVGQPPLKKAKVRSRLRGFRQRQDSTEGSCHWDCFIPSLGRPRGGDSLPCRMLRTSVLRMTESGFNSEMTEHRHDQWFSGSPHQAILGGAEFQGLGSVADSWEPAVRNIASSRVVAFEATRSLEAATRAKEPFIGLHDSATLLGPVVLTPIPGPVKLAVPACQAPCIDMLWRHLHVHWLPSKRGPARSIALNEPGSIRRSSHSDLASTCAPTARIAPAGARRRVRSR